MNKKSVAVQIAGHEYKIRSDSDEDTLHEIAAHVDRAMKRVREGTGTVDSLDVAVLTCLNLTRDLLALREQISGPAVDERIKALIDRIEAVVPVRLDDELQAPLSSSLTSSAAASAGTKAKTDAVHIDESERSGPPSEGEIENARTVELPSVDCMRERGRAAHLSAEGALPEARLAASGRDRAS